MYRERFILRNWLMQLGLASLKVVEQACKLQIQVRVGSAGLSPQSASHVIRLGTQARVSVLQP